MSFLQSGSRSAFLSFPLGNSPSFSSGSLCCPLHRSNDGTTRIFLPFSKVCTLPYSSPFRPECSGVSDIPASRLPQLCTRCKGFSLHTLSYTSYRTGDCLFKKNLQHFAFFEQQKRVPAKMQCTIFRTIILWEHVLQAIPHKDCATDASSNFSSDETKSGVNTGCIHEHFCEI